MYLIFKLFYLYTPLNLLCKVLRCLNKIIIIKCKWVNIYVVQINYKNLGRMCLLQNLNITLLYVVVSISTYI